MTEKKTKMYQDLVSIITPMYNAEKTIAYTIESVLAQTYMKWEMIIIDDASSDSSMDIVKEYVKNDSRIKLYSLNRNEGIANARNVGLANAGGRYICFLDSDDMWRSEKLMVQCELMKENGWGFSFTSCAVIDKNHQFVGKIRHVPHFVDYKKLLKGNCIPCLTVMIDREQINVPMMVNMHHEDYILWLEILKNYKGAYGIDAVLADYRISDNSISANKIKSAKWTWDIYYKKEKYGLIESLYYMINYVINALVKHV